MTRRWYLEFIVVATGDNNIVDLNRVRQWNDLTDFCKLVPSIPSDIVALQASVVVACQSMGR